jgi:SLOG cluster2
MSPKAQRPALESKDVDLDQALDLVVKTYQGKRQPLPPLIRHEKFRLGSFSAFTDTEAAQLAEIRELMVRYLSMSAPPRPLCIAVFGPPGSGKSFAVEELRDDILAHWTSGPKPDLPLTTLNMTQITRPEELGRAIRKIVAAQRPETTPLVFFDEFDAPRDGSRLGWLPWFLAPMHDGQILNRGGKVKLKRAIFVFAGGTADTMRDFSSQESAEFRDAKGPDFVSRLRGYLDVLGPNAEPRLPRRALIMRNEFHKRAERAGHPLTPTRELVAALLSVGRYRHGARSVAAVLELGGVGATEFDWSSLPDDQLLHMNIDRGPLEPAFIGGPIALSGFPSGGYADGGLITCCRLVARSLWEAGATLVDSGSWAENGGVEQAFLLTELAELPMEPHRTLYDREHPATRLTSVVDPPFAATDLFDQAIDPQAWHRHVFDLTSTDFVPYANDGRAGFGDTESVKIADHFRRRLATSELAVARVGLAGDIDRHGARISALAEEIMLTLALNRPVYLTSIFGGAAAAVGQLLGLSELRTGRLPDGFQADDELESRLRGIADSLQPGPLTKLPITPGEIAGFLREHAVGGPLWPDNGLTVGENRELFRAPDMRSVAELVVRGLVRRFGVR